MADSPLNGTMIQCFHWYIPDNMLWKEVADKARFLADRGVTAVWLPPATKAAGGSNSVGYDIYDLYDLGEFDQKGTVRTRYGTRQEYGKAVRAIQETGMQVLVDIILNHKAGGDETERIRAFRVKPDDRNHADGTSREIEAYTKFNFPGRNCRYSPFIWDHQCFTGTDYDKLANEKAIFRFESQYGDGWQKMVGDEMGNYDFLMYCDLDYRNPSVRKEMLAWARWYHDSIPFDGVRLDAMKHLPADYCEQWLDGLRKHAGREIFAVGEYWSPDRLDELVEFIDASHGKITLFDSLLQSHFCRASRSKDFDMRSIFDKTLVATRPGNTVTVIDNHDTQALRPMNLSVDHWFRLLAYALILLREGGYPCIFYPDLFGARYSGKGADGADHEVQMDKVDCLEAMMAVRRDHAYGRQCDYLDHGNCIGWVRQGDEHHDGCAVLLSTGDNGSKHMEIGARYAGKKFRDILGKQPGEIVIDTGGWAEFHCPARGVSVWISS